MTRKQRRLILIGSALGVLALAVGLVLGALKDSIVFFNSPTDLVEKHVAPGARLRLGGLVKEGSVVRGDTDDVSYRSRQASIGTLPRHRAAAFAGRPDATGCGGHRPFAPNYAASRFGEEDNRRD